MKASTEQRAGPDSRVETPVDVTGLALVRGGLLLFEGLSFTLAPGETLVVTGPNGAGKTSLLRSIAGLLAPAEGEIRISVPIGYLAADAALKPDRTVEDELRFWAALDGADRAQCEDAIRMMAVEQLLDLPCGWLSSGQRQRVSLARLLASGSGLWVMDEPFNALDARSCDRLRDAIEAHRQRGGMAMIATHLPLAVSGMRTLRLEGGRTRPQLA